MSKSAAIAETLRAVRGETDIITKLKEGSLEARRERLAEALRDPNWDGGPADLIATYPHHVIARKEGVLMRIQVVEDESSIRLGRAEVFSLPAPVEDVGAELMKTAAAAAELVLKEDYDAAQPMIRSIAGALDIKGDYHRRLKLDLGLRSLGRRTWWHDTISEQFAADVKLPETTDPVTALDGVANLLKESSASAAAALKQLSSDSSPKYRNALECARDIAEDLRSAITTLADVNRDDREEVIRVCEELGRVMPRLLAGVNFLKHLSGSK